MSFVAALGSGFFSGLCVWFSSGISKIDERVVKVFVAVYGYLRQLLYFGWGANDLRVAKVEQNQKSGLDRLMAGYMLLISGVIGVVHETLCLLSNMRKLNLFVTKTASLLTSKSKVNTHNLVTTMSA